MAKFLKWLSFGYEAFLAIPIVGGTFILAYGWIPLGVAFILHLITLILAVKENLGKAGSILGLITSVIGLIPVVGWIMHVATAITLLISNIIDIMKRN